MSVNNANTSAKLSEISQMYINAATKFKKRIIVCAGTGCVASGAIEIFEALKTEADKKGVASAVNVNFHDDSIKNSKLLMSKSGCQGFCQMGPLVSVIENGEDILYVKVTLEDVEEIINETVINGKIIDRLLYEKSGKKYKGTAEIPFYAKQTRIVLKNCGTIDAEDINEYIANGGYLGAFKAIVEMEDKDICKMILDSGLRGRGGGGFSTGMKWEFTRIEESSKKYVICNGDEGDPGAFMDRSVMEGNPHSVIEGMIIAGKAVGANKGYIYVRMEYPLAVERMKIAINQAKDVGILGENIFATNFSFDISIMEGAGAFVCGEETALIASIEGQRGMPRPKPPFPAKSGLWKKPTVINNVETLSTVPLILRDGVEEFRKYGTEKSPGTKTFALTGHVKNTGLIEVPFGTTLREIVVNVGGGVTSDTDENVDPADFKAVQIGGPSGGCLTREMIDMPLDFESLKQVGAMVGSGGLVVMNKETCMVNVAKFFMQFTQNESCGKCVLCREGTKQLLYMLETITEGKADKSTLDLMTQLGESVLAGSLCGLGKTAPNPVLSTLKYFEDEYNDHVVNKKCPAKECTALAKPYIDEKLCIGCSLCAKKCPVNAIKGEIKKPYVIDQESCVNCGVCITACKFKAVKL